MNSVEFISPPSHLGAMIPVMGDSPAIPLYASFAAAGFNNISDDYIEKRLKLEDFCVYDPTTTFFARIDGDAMKGKCINDGDLAVVDRSKPPVHGNVIGVVYQGEILVRRLYKKGSKCGLISANPSYTAIWLNDEQELKCWGVIRQVLHDV